MRFYRDLQKNLTQKSLNTSFKTYQVKETYFRTAKDKMERVWSILPIKPMQGEQAENLMDTIRGKNVLLLASIINSGKTIERLTESLSQYNPRSIKVAVAFQKTLIDAKARD